jgi:hypothetical protein
MNELLKEKAKSISLIPPNTGLEGGKKINIFTVACCSLDYYFYVIASMRHFRFCSSGCKHFLYNLISCHDLVTLWRWDIPGTIVKCHDMA